MKDWNRLWPKHWFRNYPTSYEWDAILNDLLDRHEVTVNGPYTVTIGPVEVWVSNYPFSYGYPWAPTANVMPTVKTQRRLRKRIEPVDPLSAVKSRIARS